MHERFTVRSVRPNNGIVQVHLTRDGGAHPSEILINATTEVLTQTFMHGDVWDVEMRLVSRADSNGAGNAPP